MDNHIHLNFLQFFIDAIGVFLILVVVRLIAQKYPNSTLSQTFLEMDSPMSNRTTPIS